MKKLNSGFTFIELLIALTIFSIIASGIYCTLNGALAIWQRGNSVIRDNQKIRLFFNTISQDMRNAVPYSGTEYEWADDKIVFTTIMTSFADKHMLGKLAKVAYYFDEGKGTLVKGYAALEEELDEKYIEEKVLLDNLKSFTFEYCYGPLTPEGEYEWKGEWEFEDKIPRGVKIKFTRKEEDTENIKAFENTILIPMGGLGKEE